MPDDVMGAVRFYAGLKFDINELAYWQPERISALFKGIALVLAAEAGPEAARLKRELAIQTERLERQWCC